MEFGTLGFSTNARPSVIRSILLALFRITASHTADAAFQSYCQRHRRRESPRHVNGCRISLLGAELTGVSIPVARVLGIALIALAVGCLPGNSALGSMLTYSVLATSYLLYLGIRGEWVGLLLWPAVVLHVILTALLARAWFQSPIQRNLSSSETE
jgi:hypothetical protein